MDDPESQPQVASVAWYRSEQWPRWQEIGVERDLMLLTYQNWAKGAEYILMELTRYRIEVHRIEVDVNEFIAWSCL